jgi:small-conductance mechanosensitive channel
MPVRIRVIEDLGRSRLTVFFRLLLAVPHILWLGIWTLGVLIVVFIAWFVVLFKGEMPDGLHRFFTMYLRYATHVNAYLNLAANPFPGFLGENGYEVDLEFDPPARQNRWTVGFRFILGVPAFLLGATLGGGAGGSFSSGASTYGVQIGGVLSICALLTWFYALFTARAPEGIARLQWYSIHYGAQVAAYALLLTDRYPTSDPERVGVPWPAPEHPVRLRREPDDGTRTRLTVFFRLLLAFPHFVWLLLWGVAVFFVAIANWIVTIIRAESPEPLHRFLAAYVRYETHVIAFVTLVSNPFPGFTGTPRSYPVDVEIAPPARHNRWSAGFRLVLAFPAFLLNSAIGGAMFVAAFLGWFAALFTGRMPDGLRKLGLLALRYSAQTSSYGYLLLTNRYPYAGPPA